MREFDLRDSKPTRIDIIDVGVPHNLHVQLTTDLFDQFDRVLR